MTVPVVDCVGIELEADWPVRGNCPRDLRNYWNETHDASCETPVNVDRRTGIVYKKAQPGKTTTVIVGSEFVSKVIDTTTENVQEMVKGLVGYLSDCGEMPESTRSGIHFHISMPNGLKVSKSVLRVASHLEQVFYYLGGMGYEHRGVSNDFTYCRPITGPGPSCIISPRTGNPVQCFVLSDLLRATNTRDFWNRYGGIIMDNPPGKYFPIRYNWVTLYNLLNKGTVEFRVFNKSLNPRFILATLEFSRRVCETALYNSSFVSSLVENSIYDEHNKDHVLTTFRSFVNESRMALDLRMYKTLETIIARTPDIKVERKYYYTHLRNFEWTGFNNGYTTPDVEHQVYRPNFIDVHTLGA